MMADVGAVLMSVAVLSTLGMLLVRPARRAAGADRHRPRLARVLTRGARASAAVFGALLLGALAAATARAEDTPPTVQWQSPSAYFSPNGDGQSDELSLAYTAQQTGSFTAVVRDSAGLVVRTLESAVEHSMFEWVVLAWDGRDDAGQFVVDGRYAAAVTGVNAAGSGPASVLPVGVDTRAPATVVEPAAGSAIAGAAVPWQVQPAAGLSLTIASIECAQPEFGSQSWESGRADGSVSGAFDATGCRNGANALLMKVQWSDGFGTPQSWSAPPVPVTVGNVPRVDWVSRWGYFSPDGDGQSDTLTYDYTLTQDASVTTTIEDAAGRVVRSIDAGAPREAGMFSVTWDGRDDSGVIVADGRYLVVAQGTNAYGTGPRAAIEIGVDTAAPASVTAPGAGSTISGAEVPWQVQARPGVRLDSATIRCDIADGFVSATAYPNPDGSVLGTLDVTRCGNGPNTLFVTVRWVDDSFTQRSWTAAPVSVFIANPPLVAWASSPQYLSPDGDGQDDYLAGSYYYSQSGFYTTVVRNPGGLVVRTLEAGLAREWTPFQGPVQLVWDGTDDAGHVVPDGRYQLEVTGTNAYGAGPSASLQVGVDTVAPAVVTVPGAGAVIAGSAVPWQVVPRPGVQLNSALVSCERYSVWGSSSGEPDAQGTMSGLLDVTGCVNGDNSLRADVTWIDDFGSFRSWRTPPRPVVVTNPVTVAWSGERQYFTPNGDGQGDQLVVSYTYSQPGDFTTVLVDSSGVAVRTLEAAVNHPWSPDGNYVFLTLDGKADDGRPLADGVYELIVTATNGAGTSRSPGLQIGIDTRPPATVLAPVAGATITGAAVPWQVQPTPGVPVTLAQLSCTTSVDFAVFTAEPDATGLLSGTFDSTGCRNGPNAVGVRVHWIDGFGNTQAWDAPPVEVLVANLPRLAWVSAPQVITPNADGETDDVVLIYSFTQSGEFSTVVRDAVGTPVRTLESAVSHDVAFGSYVALPWDGRDDAGHVVADGRYQVSVAARNAMGSAPPIDLPIGVVAAAPGTLTSPLSGATLTGAARLSYRPADGVVVQYVEFCLGDACGFGDLSAVGEFELTLDVSTLPAGPSAVTTRVYWTDEFGQQQIHRAAPTPVVVGSTGPSDSTAPLVSGDVSPAANAAGWHHEPVTVTWTATDPEPSSGSATTPAPTSVSSEGKDQVVFSGQSCDPAGNCATGQVTISLDSTAPAITGSLHRAPEGSPAGSVLVHFTCADALSGVQDCTADQVTAPGTVVGTATDVAGNTATSIVVVDTPRFTSADPGAALVGAAYRHEFAVTGLVGAIFTVDPSTLPPGLTLAEDGILTGTPTAGGSFRFTVRAANDIGQVATAEVVIEVRATPAITSGPPPTPLVVGRPVSFPMTASGYPAPTFAVASGSLPVGLTLTAAGLLEGTPTALGDSSFTVAAANVAGVTSAAYRITVVRVAPRDLRVRTAVLPVAHVGTAYEAGLSATGGTSPYLWRIVSGALPQGLTLDPATGRITGTATRAGTYAVTVAVVDGAQPALQAQATVSVRVVNRGGPPPRGGAAAAPLDPARAAGQR